MLLRDALQPLLLPFVSAPERLLTLEPSCGHNELDSAAAAAAAAATTVAATAVAEAAWFDQDQREGGCEAADMAGVHSSSEGTGPSLLVTAPALSTAKEACNGRFALDILDIEAKLMAALASPGKQCSYATTQAAKALEN
mmetsp:Transcript_97097/g.172853  ORF Transcript_97097/g.172853 Transcript_97097/m.172853 type:complete len:140 (+) Transcript_97097:750-1169(+)